MDSKSKSWFEVVNENTLFQGDIIESCPIFLPPDTINDSQPEVSFNRVEYDVIVMTQTCDIIQNKTTELLLCPVYFLSEFTGDHLATDKGKEDARRGNLPAFHMLNKCEIKGHEREIRIVEFKRVFSLPINFVRNRAEASGERLRLLPPYREHLSQSFARYFMRVGLPADIPPFK